MEYWDNGKTLLRVASFNSKVLQYCGAAVQKHKAVKST